MESKIHSEIQKQLIYMIPEKWNKIALYATVDNNMSGELFFYYVPKAITKEEPINCYEIPSLFDIDEDEYLELLYGIYNKIKILKRIYLENNKNWSNLTIIIDDETFKISYSYENLNNYPFNPYERHLIWRKEILNILPVLKKDKKIIEKYDKIKDMFEVKREVKYEKRENVTSRNVVNFERVLTVDEALAQSTKKQKNKKNNNEKEENKLNRKLTKEEKNIIRQRRKQEKEFLKLKKKQEKLRNKQQVEMFKKRKKFLFSKEHKNRIPDE